MSPALLKAQEIARKSVPAILVALLFALFFVSLFGEKHPYNDGAGFDGTFYREVFQNFSIDFFAHGYDSFRIQRIFPFCLMNIVYRATGIPLDNAHMIWGMGVLHVLNLVVLVVFFFKLASLRGWKASTSAILFSVTFFSYFILKNCGYELFQTDDFAMTIAFVSYYLLLRGKTGWSYAISLLGLVTWPTVTIVNLLLILFRQPVTPTGESRFGKILYRCAPVAYAVAAAGFVAASIVFRKQLVLSSLLQTDFNLWSVALSFATASIVLWIIGRQATPFPYTPAHFIKAPVIKSAILLAIPVIAVKAILWAHTNDEFFFDGKLFLLQILIRPLKYPAITIAGHVAYLGILLPLTLIVFRQFSKNIVSLSPGHALAFLAVALLSLDSEARHIIPFIPLVLAPLGTALDNLDLSARRASLLIALQLLLSHFYLPINDAGLATALDTQDFASSSAQRFFMSFGPWMTFQSYILWIAVSFVVFITLWAVFRTQERPIPRNRP